MTAALLHPRVVSFDVEGTLVTHHFTRYVWQDAVPRLYAQRYGLTLDEAEATVLSEYLSIGTGRSEWFDIDYWLRRFGLGEAEALIESHRSLIEYYPETTRVLDALNGRYTLIAASSTPLRFLHYILGDIESCFVRVFSATSRFGKTKDPEFFAWICDELGVAPSDVVHVGDNWQGDFVSAAAAGLTPLYLDRSRSDGSALGSLDDLLPLLQ
jgi:FMN phosphatase YigB (HAD superfamily)